MFGCELINANCNVYERLLFLIVTIILHLQNIKIKLPFFYIDQSVYEIKFLIFPIMAAAKVFN